MDKRSRNYQTYKRDYWVSSEEWQYFKNCWVCALVTLACVKMYHVQRDNCCGTWATDEWGSDCTTVRSAESTNTSGSDNSSSDDTKQLPRVCWKHVFVHCRPYGVLQRMDGDSMSAKYRALAVETIICVVKESIHTLVKVSLLG